MHQRMTFAVVFLAVSLTCVPGRAQQNGPIVRLDPALDEILPAGAKLETLAEGLKDGLEGGVWVRSGGYLLFSHKPERVIKKWTPDGKLSVYLDLSKFAKIDDPTINLSSGTTLDAQGRLVYCSQGERAVIRIEKDGKRTILADRYEGKRFAHPNDLVYKRDGTLYFTDNGEDEMPRSAYFLKSGTVHLITRGQLVRPNGIALSPDEKYLYINDSGGGGKRVVWRFEVQPDDTAINGRLFIDMSSDPATGIPDGMKVDTKGNIYDAGPGGLWILSPEGKHLGTVLTPDQATNFAFGDADGKTLYLINHTALYRIRVNIEGLRP